MGGAGVQRAVKFVKYLPQFGWQPSVLTVANPSVPVQDASLASELPADAVVRRARTFEPSYAVKSTVIAANERPGLRGRIKSLGRQVVNTLLQPDPQVLWLPAALRAGSALLAETPHDAIVATGPPFSSFVLGAMLSRRSGLPLVLDYRDEWGLSNTYLENKRVGRLARFVQERMQIDVVGQASALVATTRASAETLEEVRAQSGSTARVQWIYNGFDGADFPAVSEVPGCVSPYYRLVYVGTLWNLTSPAPLVRGVQRLAERSPALAARLELVFAGRRTPSQQAVVDQLRQLPCRVVEHPYLNHEHALELVRGADGLCVLLSDVPGAQRVVPAKLFEYFAARRPILAVAPPGECWKLLRDHPAVHLLEPGDPDSIALALADELRRDRPEDWRAWEGWNPARFERRRQTGELAALLDDLTPSSALRRAA